MKKQVDQEKQTEKLIEAMLVFDLATIRQIFSSDFQLTLIEDGSQLYYRRALSGVFRQYPDKFQELIDIGLQPDYESTRFTSIFCDADKPELVRLFIHDKYQKNIALPYAITSNNKELQEYIIKNSTPEEKSYLLSSAISDGDVDEVRLLHQHGAKLSLEENFNTDAWTSLIKNHPEKFLDIINIGIKTDFAGVAPTFTGLTRAACSSENIDIIRFFMKTNYQLNTILAHSVQTNNMILFREVIAHKPSPINEILIRTAVRNGRFEMIKLLCDIGANLDDNLLFIAAESNRLDVFNYLLDKGLNVNMTNSKNENLPTFLLNHTFRERTLTGDQLNICKSFAITDVSIKNLKAFARQSCFVEGLEYVRPIVLASDTDYQEFLVTCYDCALKIKAPTEVFSWLFKEGLVLEDIPAASRDDQKDCDFTLLHAAAFHGAAGVIPFLLERDFSVNAETTNGYTPLHFARSESAVTTLCDNGADVNKKSIRGLTPVHMAIQTNSIQRQKSDGRIFVYYGEVLSSMVSRSGFNPAMVDGCGNNYIHWLMRQPETLGRGYLDGGECAIGSGPNVSVFTRLLTVLIAAGVDINETNIYGATPFDLAETQEIKVVLVEHGAKSRPQNTDHPAVRDIKMLHANLPNLSLGKNTSYLMFQCAVAAFKRHYGIDSLGMLNDFSNPAARIMRACFLTFPAIANYLARNEITIEHGMPVITEHEKCFYTLPHFSLSSGISYRCYNDNKGFDECLSPIATSFDQSFFYCNDNDQRRLFEKILKKQCSEHKENNILIKFGAINEEIDRIQRQYIKQEGYLFIVFAAYHPTCAIFDLDKNETVALILCDPFSQHINFGLFTNHFNDNREETDKLLCINASHDLDLVNDKGRTLYNFCFNHALIRILGDNEELRMGLTKNTKEELKADPEKQKELSNLIQNAMKQNLPQYYQGLDGGDGFERREITEVEVAHYKMHWAIGGDIILEQASNTKDLNISSTSHFAPNNE